jgi:hypothetical protein
MAKHKESHNMAGRGRSALQGSETVDLTEVTCPRVNNVAASWEWVWSFRSSCSKSRNYMQFCRQLHAPDSLLMGIETFVLIRQETGWGREETWMWRRKRRVPNSTDLYIYLFLSLLFYCILVKNLTKTIDSVYVRYVEYTCKLRTVAMFVTDFQKVFHKGCLSICLWLIFMPNSTYLR